MVSRFTISDRTSTLIFGLTEGVLIASLVINARDAIREDAFFRAVAREATAASASDEARLLAIMHKSNQMLAPLLQGIKQAGLQDLAELAGHRRIFFGDLASDLIYPKGQCGSSTGVFVKLLKCAGFPVRIGQMLDGDDVSNAICHHVVVEVFLDGRWVICDPYYDLVFRDQAGRILGFDEIRRDWERLKEQAPPDYDMRYDYKGFRKVNFGRLNPWLQKTPLARWSIRTLLIEGAWLRTVIAATLLALVVGVHVWFERLSRSVTARRSA